MLGVRRSGVTEALGAIQLKGIIKRSRGSIVILDMERLYAAACECHVVIRDEYDRLLGIRSDSRKNSRCV
jgi:hypothetical protein